LIVQVSGAQTFASAPPSPIGFPASSPMMPVSLMLLSGPGTCCTALSSNPQPNGEAANAMLTDVKTNSPKSFARCRAIRAKLREAPIVRD
jgi:hypothetical protein